MKKNKVTNMTKSIYWSLLLALAVTGAAMIYCSLSYPWYTVSDEELAGVARRLESKPRNERFREWYAERAKLATPRKMLSDTGTGLLALALGLGVLRLSTGFPLRGSRTPNKRWQFIVIYLFTVATMIPSSFWYFSHRQMRYEYPSWGDSIIIGIFETILGCVLLAVIGSLFWWPFLANSKFPAPLFAWPRQQPVFNTIVTIVFGGLALFFLFDNKFGSIRGGDISGVWLSIVLAYLLLSLRAGMVKRRAEKKSQEAESVQVQEAASTPPGPKLPDSNTPNCQGSP